MSFHKVRAGRWQSTASAYRIEARGPRCFAILLDGRIVAQAGTIEGAMAEVLREYVERAQREHRGFDSRSGGG